MMQIQHKDLAAGRWNDLSLIKQMANIGSEVIRTLKWKNKRNYDYANHAFYRALELFDLTLIDRKNRERLKEVARAREVFVGYFLDEDPFHTTDEGLESYFLGFNYAARNHLALQFKLRHTQKDDAQYISVLRKMDGNKRAKIGAELYDMARQLVESSIRNENPGIGKEELKRLTNIRMNT